MPQSQLALLQNLIPVTKPHLAFHQPVKQRAGADSNEARGEDSVELTSDRGRRALERQQETASTASKVLEKFDPALSAQVKEAMEWWLWQADDLQEISSALLKSQKKLGPDRIQKLKRHVLERGVSG